MNPLYLCSRKLLFFPTTLMIFMTCQIYFVTLNYLAVYKVDKTAYRLKN